MFDLPATSAEPHLQRYMRWSGLRGGKGFRQMSTKNGPARQMTYSDRLLVQVIGTQGIPQRSQSDRKRVKRVRHALYLNAVRDNPKYPRGDRRLKEQSNA